MLSPSPSDARCSVSCAIWPVVAIWSAQTWASAASLSLHTSGATPTAARSLLCTARMALTSSSVNFPVLLLAVDVVGKVALLSVDPLVDEPLLSVVVVVDPPPVDDEPLLSVVVVVVDPPPVDDEPLLSVVVVVVDPPPVDDEPLLSVVVDPLPPPVDDPE